MARKLRVQYPGSIYHVMNRADRREPIFKQLKRVPRVERGNDWGAWGRGRTYRTCYRRPAVGRSNGEMTWSKSEFEFVSKVWTDPFPTPSRLATLDVADSQLRGVYANVDSTTGTWMTVGLTNNLVERSELSFYQKNISNGMFWLLA